MANVQTYFNKFDEKIRRSYNDNSILREKRDLLVNDLRVGLRRYFQDYNMRTPRFETFNQGSYAIGTGIEPLPGEDYDIDVGLVFHLSKNDHSSVQVKQWVHGALQSGNRTVEYKRPCVRVQYHRAGSEVYHVDLAVYSESPSDWDNQMYLAKGFPGSVPENRIWEVADPKKLVEVFQQRFQHQGDRDQFRRIIRFLKRWKDVTFSANGNERPTGIAISACALKWFQVGSVCNFMDGKNYYDDLTALKYLTESIINYFNFGSRITVSLPVPPYNDLFEKMSDKQMSNFKIKLVVLREELIRAEEAHNTLRACQNLQGVFGSDFPTQ
ncbi:MAG: nucleotidyltransferase [Candidatus Poribacteria bacterium]|nr:nucleotidyltransferase [Candidatus Poribacteria bacterium]